MGREDRGREDGGREDRGREDGGREDRGREDRGRELTLHCPCLSEETLEAVGPSHRR